MTKWIFKAQESINSRGCTTWLSTWRPNRTADSVYDRVNKTDTSGATRKGSVLTYEVVTRGIHVQRDDIFGIEIECLLSNSTVGNLNILDISNNSRSVASPSYRRTGIGLTPQIIISSVTPQWNYFPIVKPIMGELRAKTHNVMLFQIIMLYHLL